MIRQRNRKTTTSATIVECSMNCSIVALTVLQTEVIVSVIPNVNGEARSIRYTNFGELKKEQKQELRIGAF